jgi:hypothetical protein
MDGFIRFRCPSCGKRRKAPPEYAGKAARCSCGERIIVPDSALSHPYQQPDPSPDLVGHSNEPYSDELYPSDDTVPFSDSHWPAVVVTCVACLLALGVLAFVFVKGSDEHRVAVTVISAIVSALACAVFMVAYCKKCSFWQAVGWTVLGIGAAFLGVAAAALFVAIVLMYALLAQRSTLRPHNYCGACGHSWYPRGHDYSPRCPHCGRRR